MHITGGQPPLPPSAKRATFSVTLMFTVNGTSIRHIPPSLHRVFIFASALVLSFRLPRSVSSAPEWSSQPLASS